MNRIQPVSAWGAVVALPEPSDSPNPHRGNYNGDRQRPWSHRSTSCWRWRQITWISSRSLSEFGPLSDTPDERKACSGQTTAYVYPGGTLFEIAFYQGMLKEFLTRAQELGFTYVEISEGTIDLPRHRRAECIKMARDWGFGVVSEIGKKDKSLKIQPAAAVEQILTDLENGSEKVIIEGRDSGKGVGIYDDQGAVNDSLLDEILAGIKSASKILIEAPQTSQQNHLLLKLGPNVNLRMFSPMMCLPRIHPCRTEGDTLRVTQKRRARIGRNS